MKNFDAKRKEMQSEINRLNVLLVEEREQHAAVIEAIEVKKLHEREEMHRDFAKNVRLIQRQKLT